MNYEKVIKLKKEIAGHDEKINVIAKDFEALLNNAYQNYLSKVNIKGSPSSNFYEHISEIENSLLEDRDLKHDVQEVMSKIYDYNKEVYSKETSEKLNNLEYIDYEAAHNGYLVLNLIKDFTNDIGLQVKLEELFELIKVDSQEEFKKSFNRYLNYEYRDIVSEIEFDGERINIVFMEKNNENENSILMESNWKKILYNRLKRKISVLETLAEHDFVKFNKACSELEKIYEVNIKDFNYYDNLKNLVLKEYE